MSFPSRTLEYKSKMIVCVSLNWHIFRAFLSKTEQTVAPLRRGPRAQTLSGCAGEDADLLACERLKLARSS
jgi:hypothetical protein